MYPEEWVKRDVASSTQPSQNLVGNITRACKNITQICLQLLYLYIYSKKRNKLLFSSYCHFNKCLLILFNMWGSWSSMLDLTLPKDTQSSTMRMGYFYIITLVKRNDYNWNNFNEHVSMISDCDGVVSCPSVRI